MNEARFKRRAYSSNLRQQQQENTRRLIMESVAAIIAEGHLLSFSVQDVAKRAGVSYASVYRHFPTRETLLEALYETEAQVIGSKLTLTSLSLEEISAAVGRLVEMLEQSPTVAQAATMAFAVSNIQPENRRIRDRNFQDMITETFPHLDPPIAKQATAIICHLYSTLTWATLKGRFGLNQEDLTEALTWAMQTLLRDLSQRVDSKMVDGS
jgi:AcrR family transcriptional regulator